MKSSHSSTQSKVTHAYLKQTYQGVEVVNGDMSVHVDEFGRVFSYSSSFFEGKVEDHVNANEYPQLVMQAKESWISPIDAVVKFAEFINEPLLEVSALTNSFLTDDTVFPGDNEGVPTNVIQPVQFTRDGQVPIVTKYLISNDALMGLRLVPVWDMSVDLLSGDSWYNAQMDVMTGQVLSMVDWVSEHKYNVFPIGVNDPHDGERQLMVNPEDKLASPLGWHDQGSAGNGRGDDGDAKFNGTIGNNVFAQSNPNGRNDYFNNYRPTGVSDDDGMIFNNTLDLSKDPKSYIDASVTNLFYWNNVVHDIFYNYGFDEMSGNFQQDNLGRGGKGKDAVIANAQDGSGYNNANFATPPDGLNGRMRMYVWTQTNPRRDGDLEAGIVIHEYAHGISTRLTGGPSNSGCLGYGEAGGMGEGWGDAFANMLRMRANYKNDIEFPMGKYSAARGIRPFDYSRSMTTNPHVYSFIKKSGYSGVHAMGSVWATILYEVYWSFVDEFGFNADWYSISDKSIPTAEIKGNIRIMALIVEGMKLQPCRPSFVDARNAIIRADEVMYEGQHACLLWKSFAKRGLGMDAKKGGVDSFDVPTECK